MRKLLIRLWEWFDDRTGVGALIGPMLAHRVPPGSTWPYVLGSATLIAFIVQVVTGISLALAYVPSTHDAYASLRYINDTAVLGHFVRALHYFGASAMVLLIGLHTIRTYLFASYKYPREVSWLSGVVLLFMTIGMGFTGQLLRWDDNGVWSVIVGAEQAGRVPFIGKWVAHFVLAGDTVGGATLSRFFAFHVFFIPAVIFGVVGLHLWLVLRNGISEPPRSGRPVDPKHYRDWYHKMLDRVGVPFWPDAMWRDILFGLIVILAIGVLAVVYGAPELLQPPDPSIIYTNPRPDWYLLWYFAVLALLPPYMERYVMVFGPLLIAVILFSVPFTHRGGERVPTRRPWALFWVLCAVLMISTLWNLGVRAPWSPNFDAPALPAEVVGNIGTVGLRGAQLFHDKGCEFCHRIDGYGGQRGPDLSTVGSRLTDNELAIRIMNGGYNMPAFAGTLTHDDTQALVTFLRTRTSDRFTR
ncbi:MAG: cytochrome b N-terminal domain-containing protein [Candidatus Xenobia bacterium]